MQSDNHLPPFHTPFFTITITPIVILSSDTQQTQQQTRPSNGDAPLYAFFATLFTDITSLPNNSLGLQGQPPASEAAMNAQRILKPDQIPLGATCCVCIEELFQTSTNGDQTFVNTVRCMPCDHAYHETCLFTWLQQSATCPTCRYEIESDNLEWNAASRRRAADRAERARELREEQERKRRADRRANHQSACGLAAVGCCEFDEGNELDCPPDSAFDNGEKNIVLLSCRHSFHRNCLVTNLCVSGQEEFTVNGELRADSCPPVEVRCPCCRKITSMAGEEQLVGGLGEAVGPFQRTPNATADDRPAVAVRQQASTESESTPKGSSDQMLRETLLPEELETD